MYEFFTWQLPINLQLAVVVIAVVCSIGYNDMVRSIPLLQQENKKGCYSLEQQPSIKNKLKTNNLKTINNKK